MSPVFGTQLCWHLGLFSIFLLGGIFFQSEMMIVTLLTMPDCKTAKSTVHAVMSEECLHRYFKMNRIVCVHGGWKSLKKSHFKKIPKFTFYPNSPFFAFFSKFIFFSKWDFLWFFQTLWCYVDVVFSPAPVVDCWFFYAFCTFSLFHCSLHSSVFSVFPDVLLYLFLSLFCQNFLKSVKKFNIFGFLDFSPIFYT